MMKAKIRQFRTEKRVADNGWSDDFILPYMRLKGVHEFRPLVGYDNWYTYEGYKYHISWLIPVEDENE